MQSDENGKNGNEGTSARHGKSGQSITLSKMGQAAQSAREKTGAVRSGRAPGWLAASSTKVACRSGNNMPRVKIFLEILIYDHYNFQNRNTC
jgi:hypothetical protein